MTVRRLFFFVNLYALIFIQGVWATYAFGDDAISNEAGLSNVSPEDLDWRDLVDRARTRTTPVVLDDFVGAHRFAEEQIKKYKGFRTMRDELPADMLGFLEYGRAELRSAYEAHRDGLIKETHWAALASVFIQGEMRKNRRVRLRALERTFERDIKRRLELTFNRYAEYEKDPREPVIIQFMRVGDEQFVGPEGRMRTRAFIDHFLAAGFPIMEHRFGTRAVLANLARLPQQVEDVMSAEPGRPEAFSITERGNFSLNLRNISARVAHAFSMMRGLSLVQFRRVAQSRSQFDKTVEPISGAIRFVTTGYAVYSIQSHQLAEGKVVNPWLPLVVILADKMFFSIYQKPMSAFFGQGKTWSYESMKERDNKLLFTFLVLLNSFLLRGANDISGHTVVNFVIPSLVLSMSVATIFSDALMSSLRGVWAKAPIQFGLERFRKRYAVNALLVTSVITAWNVIWDATGIADLFNATSLPPFLGGGSFKFREVLMWAAVVGFGVDTIRDHETFGRWARMAGRVFQQKPVYGFSDCETFLSFESAREADYLGSVNK